MNSSPTQYRTWVVENQPDLTGQEYTGYKSGPNPLLDIVAYEVADDNAIVDFSYPNALDWDTTKRVLPEVIYNSQLAIIDGYAYLFGGEQSSKIYRAALNNPADWLDTGAHLPTPLSSSQLAVIDGYIYLFGGTNAGSVNTIYSAPVNNPLEWTNHGALLPGVISGSQLGLFDGYLYLFGGFGGNAALNVIYMAHASDPLTWVDTGHTLPVPLYNSQIAIIDSALYLFGGTLNNGLATNAIYTAIISHPTSWTFGAVLPFNVSSSQFVSIGDFGYLFAPANPLVSYTQIFRCNLNSPLSWVDTRHALPGIVSESQLAIIYDRIWLFGGNGSSIIFATNPVLSYSFTASEIVIYGYITRTLYNSFSNPLDPFSVLGFPNWKTDYGM